jgi:glucose/mannose transport system permease protein
LDTSPDPSYGGSKRETRIAYAAAKVDIAQRHQDASAIRRWRLSRALIYGALALFALVYLLPAFVVLCNAFRTYPEISRNGVIGLPQGISFSAFNEAWNNYCVSGTCDGIKANFLNSLIITIPPTIISTALGAINGYVLSKWRFRGSEIVFGAMLLGVFMPGQVTLLPWAFILGKIHLYNSVYGLILIHSAQGIAFATLFCRNFYAAIPDDLIKAARIDGAGFWRIFRRIVLPLSPPILIVTVIWQFTSIWNEFLYGVVFTAGDQQPVTAALLSVGAGGQSAAVLIAALPPLLIYLWGGRYFVRGLTMGAVK